MDDLPIWIILCITCSLISFYYGKHVEAKHNVRAPSNQPYEKLQFDEEEMGTPSDSQYYKTQLNKEKATRRRITDEYEQEIDYLKQCLSTAQEHGETRQRRHESDQQLFDEMQNEMLNPVPDNSDLLSNDEIDKELF